ncbi:MAG: Maf family protein [Alphaproteobacteria bacterium]
MIELQRPELRLVLASASPARRRLLEAAGLVFAVRTSPVDEALVREGLKADGVGGDEAAVALASLKGERVALGAARDEIVLAGDQLLETADGAWPDKPEDTTALEAQLARLAGTTHTLHTAAVLFRGGSRVWHHVASPRVTVRALSPDAIRRYVAVTGDDVLGCVGGYQLEGLGAHLLANIRGDAFAAQGLPLLAVLAALRAQGVLWDG